MKVNVNVSSGATPAEQATTGDLMPKAVPVAEPMAKAPAPEPAPEVPVVAAPAPAEVKKRRMAMPKLPVSKKALIIISLMGVAAVVILLSLSYVSARRKLSQAQNPEQAAQVEAENLVEKVSRLVSLPTGETPTVATVVDVSKLKGQAFFANAENGDKVLMFTTAKKAVLYRPSSNQVVEIAPINIGQTAQPAPAPAPAPAPPAAPKRR